MDRNIITLIRKTDPRIHAIIAKTEENAVIKEIRFRKNRRLTFTVGDENLVTDFFVTETMIGKLFEELCQGSVYAHTESINNGYIMLPGGVRAGICGRAMTEL